jgi:hypothetical protein
MSDVFIVKMTNQVATTYLRLKVRRKEEQTNRTVKHNLCYRVSNEPRITTDFYELQWTPKFTGSQRITDIDIIYICKHICTYILSFLALVVHGLVLIQIIYT